MSSSRRAFTCRHSDAIAILLSALLFALYHGNLVQFCYALPMGILLALLATWTSSLLPSILLHITINVSSYFTGMLPFALPHTGCILATGITSAAGFIALYLLLRRSGKSHKVS
ncbi:MAG: lysostaphin resistance A-like protein [Coprococcus sp.]